MTNPNEDTDDSVGIQEVIHKNTENTWTNNIEKVLDKLRINCCQLSNFHKFKYQHCKSQVKWFRIPIIILSGINTFASVGLQEHLEQNIISIISSSISLLCGIITGIEMFMKYQDKMETELATHKEYYRISIDIYKMISIDRKHRKISGKDFLEAKFNEYEKIKSRSRPEDPSDLVYDILADMDELFLYKRSATGMHKNGWINKIELAPPLYAKQNSSLGVSYDRLRHPERYALRLQSKTLENKVKITQKYMDERWKYKKEEELKKKKEEELNKKKEEELNKKVEDTDKITDNSTKNRVSTNSNNYIEKHSPKNTEDTDEYFFNKSKNPESITSRIVEYFHHHSDKIILQSDDENDGRNSLSLDIDTDEEDIPI